MKGHESMASHTQTAARPLPPPPPDWLPPPKKHGGAGKALAIVILLLLLLYIVFYTPIGALFLEGLAGQSYPESATFTLNREITLDISRGEISWTCDIPVPRDISGGSTQDIELANPSPSMTPTEKYGGDWIAWTGTDSDTVTLGMTYRATVHTVIWRIDAQDSATASDIPQAIVDRHCGDEWEIEDEDGNPTGEYIIWPEHPTIAALAGQLTSDSRTVFENVESVYDYLRDRLEYQTVPGSEPKQCLITLADESGDCDDQSILLISLLRAAGIPSWLAFGMLYDRGSGEWGPHAWAEVYIPLRTGTSGSAVIDIVNGEFLVRNCNRLEEWKDDGIGEHLSDYYHILSYNYTLAGPHPQVPVVTISDDYSGDFQASQDRVSGVLAIPETPPFRPGKLGKVF